MPGSKQTFEAKIEAAVAAHDDLPPDLRANVLTQLANQLRTSD